MMPPSRATSAVVNGKKTLSDSEVLAYSKNRFVEHSLRQKVQQLSDLEQECHDRHQREIFRWRDFIRQSSRTTGVWSTSLQSDVDPWSENEDDPQPSSAEEHDEDVPISSTQRGSPRGNPSTELARSLSFQIEALNQLQKPWIYTYSEASHNTVCKDALQVARVKEKRLLFKRTASATNRLSPSHAYRGKSASRSQSSSGDRKRQQFSARSPRPQTGRSTPGVLKKSESESRDRLTASASVNKNRPKTSVGVVRVSQKQPKSAWTATGKQDGSGNSGVKSSVKMSRVGLDSSKTVHTQNSVSDTKDNCDTSGSNGVENTTEVGKVGWESSQTDPTQNHVSDGLHAEDSVHTTGEESRDSGYNGHISGDNGCNASGKGCIPGDNGHNSGDNGHNSGDNGLNSGDNGHNSGDNGLNPGDNDHNSGDNGLNPGDNGHNSGDNGHCAEDNRDTEDNTHITIVKFSDHGGPVQTLPIKEKTTSVDKLPIIQRRKHGMVSNIRLTLDGNTVVEDTDSFNSRLTEQVTPQANSQTNAQQTSEQGNEQRSYSISSVDTTSTAESVTTPEVFDDKNNTSKRPGKERNKRQHIRFAAWKEKTDNRTSETNADPANETVTSQSLTIPKDGAQTESDADVKENQDAPLLTPSATQATPPSPINQSESSSENNDDKRLKPTATATANNRSSDVRSKGSGQQMSGISSVPMAHSAVRRRGSFMKIVDQLEALRVGNRRRSVRPDDDTDAETADKEVTRTPHESTSSMTNDKSATAIDVKDKAHHKYAKTANAIVALAIMKNSSHTKPDTKPVSAKLDKIEEGSHTTTTTKSVSNDFQSHLAETQTLQVETTENRISQGGTEKADAIEPRLELPLHPDPHSDDEDFYPMDERSLAESDFTTFNGYKIRNYVRPQYRYRSDPFLTSRRERSLIRLSIEYPVYLKGNRGDLKSDMLFPKTCRQKVLHELVQRNHQPLPVQESGVVPPELKAKIDEFFKTIEPYCPKPEITID